MNVKEDFNRMKLIRKVVLGTLGLGLTAGCSMTSEPHSIPMTNLKPKTFTFNKLNADGYEAVSAGDALNAVNKYIESNSAFQKCKTAGLYGGGTCVHNDPSGISYKWGASVSQRDQSFELTYFKIGDFGSGRVNKATIKQLFPYKLTETANTISIELSPNKEAKATPTSGFLGIPLKVNISDQNLISWTNRLFTSDSLARIDEVAMTRGEFDVDLDPDSVKANFIREHKLKFSDEKNGVQSKASADWIVDGAKVSVYMTVSLYRGKTKVEYTIRQPFALDSDGTIKNYNSLASSKTADILKKAANT